MNLFPHTVLKPLMVGTILTLVPLAAQGPRPEQGPRHEMGPRFQCANLTEAQKTSLKAIADKHQAALEAKRKAESDAQEAFHKAMQDPTTKDADLKTLFEKTNEARFAMLLEHRAMEQESQAILTPEQRAEMQKKRAEGGPHHDGGRRHDKQGHEGHGPKGPDHEGMPTF